MENKAEKKTGNKLAFRPVALAVNLEQTLFFEPKGQENLAPENRLRYELRPPTKGVLEEVQNEEISFMISEATDKHRGLVHSGTTRRLLVTNCLIGWKNLYRQTGVDNDGEPLFEEIRFQHPGQPASGAFKDIQAANYEHIPDAHVVGIVSRLKEAGQLTEIVEGKSETSSAGSTD